MSNDPSAPRRAQAVPMQARASDESEQEFWVPKGRDLLRLSLNSVLRFTAEGDYVRVHTIDQSYLLRKTLSSVNHLVADLAYLRVHRSTIVAMRDVAGLRNCGSGTWAIVHHDGTTSPIGRLFLHKVRARLGLRRLTSAD